MSADKVAFITPMQEAFMAAAVKTQPQGHHRVLGKVTRSLDRTKPKEVRSWDAKVSYRTAERLKKEGSL
jgi:hypothetical protein